MYEIYFIIRDREIEPLKFIERCQIFITLLETLLDFFYEIRTKVKIIWGLLNKYILSQNEINKYDDRLDLRDTVKYFCKIGRHVCKY